jgi:hypothetical protein
VPDPQEQFVRDVRAYTLAGEALVSGVTEFNDMNTRALEDIEQGMSLTESFERRDSAAWSRRISTLLEEFEACRRATRASAAAALMAEGKNVSDVGRAFGVSHQLASRFSRGTRTEAAGDLPTGE